MGFRVWTFERLVTEGRRKATFVLLHLHLTRCGNAQSTRHHAQLTTKWRARFWYSCIGKRPSKVLLWVLGLDLPSAQWASPSAPVTSLMHCVLVALACSKQHTPAHVLANFHHNSSAKPSAFPRRAERDRNDPRHRAPKRSNRPQDVTLKRDQCIFDN